MNNTTTIAMLTDYGLEDHYVSVLKGVIARLAPDAQIIDITHQIPPGEIQKAAVTLWQAEPYFPSGTVFLCVIDPGVGTKRRAVILESGQQKFVGPDNGLFSFILEPGYQAYELTNQDHFLPHPGRTFHGRDIFAPVAAYAARGTVGVSFGAEVNDLVKLPSPILQFFPPDSVRGQILHADRFGNLLTSLGCFFDLEDRGSIHFDPWLPLPDPSTNEKLFMKSSLCVELQDGRTLPFVENFSKVPPDFCGVLIGSSRLLEIVANQDSAAEILDLERGDIIHLRITKD